jgi:hypothetical protein
LDSPVIFEKKAIAGSAGFTRYELAKAICARYQRIYEEEAETSQIAGANLPQGFAANMPGMLNRCETSKTKRCPLPDLNHPFDHTTAYNKQLSLTPGE